MILTCFEGNIPSNCHTAQDASLVREFSNRDKQHHVLVMSDGCTGEFEETTRKGAPFLKSLVSTQFGSRWICETFYDRACKRIEDGEQGEALVREALLDVVDAMPLYQAHNRSATGATIHGTDFSTELHATLFACIVSENECVAIVAGHGFVLYNGTKYALDTVGGDAYPAYLLHLKTREARRKRLDLWMPTFSIPVCKLGRLTLCSDGVCGHLIDRLLDDKTVPELSNVLRGLHVGRGAFAMGSIPHPNARWIPGSEKIEYCTTRDDDATYVSVVNSSWAGETINLEPSFARLKDVDIAEDVRLLKKHHEKTAQRAKKDSSSGKIATPAKGEQSPAIAPVAPMPLPGLPVATVEKQSVVLLEKKEDAVAATDDSMAIPDHEIGIATDVGGAYHTRPDGTPLYAKRYKSVKEFYDGRARVFVSSRVSVLINKRGEVVA